MTVFLFLDGKDSSSVHPSNTPDDLIVTLPKQYTLDGSWKCALLEMNSRLSKVNAVSRVYVCCDIVEDSYAINNMLPILRACEVTLEVNDIKESYNPPFYFDISEQEVRSIRVFIRNDQLRPVPTSIESFACVLCLRKKKLWGQ